MERRYVATGLTVLAVLMGTALGAPRTGTVAVCFEAELANRLEPVMEIHEEGRCSGGRAVVIRQGAGAGQSSTGANGTALYSVPIPASGRYDVWLRARWLDECSNSILLLPPGGTLCTVTDHTFGNWHWVRGCAPHLEAGNHTFMLRNREDGVAVDQFLILSAGQKPPRGVVRPNVVPGNPSGPQKHNSLALAVTAVPRKLPGKPPRRYDVRHSLGGTGDGAAYPAMVCALPGVAIDLDLWLRNNTSTPAHGAVRLRQIAGLRLKKSESQDVTAAEHSLSQVSFTVVPEEELPIGEHPVRFHIRTGRKLRRAGTRLIRPLEWQFAGPFDHPAKSTIDVAHPPETDGVRRKTYTAGKKTVGWKTYPRHKTYSPFGFVDLVRLFGDVRWKACYARTQITVRESGDCQLVLMGDDMVRVWIDGVRTATADAALPATLNRRMARITLTAGKHDVLLKSCQARNYWEFFVTFAPLAGRPPAVFGVPLANQDWGSPK
ncbi:MAG: hypothetical protein HN742_33685 [Lentisphaerae bacterium]|nr:hypothetical protein [Lentisphaerota bacterium]MBT4822483.1 hypothetical protein [Lentisphaerota bacterium]MBT5611415.1 hypothetical protein [Lentisphaerota bacterium]MBT7059643.1 hypothetical protein [Lentisphaerota bacterium]MBT7846872.1 hypothetical protein [Lentisphaerota bacterium]